MPIWEKLVFCSVSSAWADFWRWRHLSDWVQKISCNYCAVPHLRCPSTGKAGTTHPHLHSQPGAGKCYKAFAKWMCLPFLGLQSQSSIRKQLQTETGRLGMTPTWTEREKATSSRSDCYSTPARRCHSVMGRLLVLHLIQMLQIFFVWLCRVSAILLFNHFEPFSWPTKTGPHRPDVVTRVQSPPWPVVSNLLGKVQAYGTILASSNWLREQISNNGNSSKSPKKMWYQEMRESK